MGCAARNDRRAQHATLTSNRHLNRVQVVPITSNTDRLYPSEAYIDLNGEQRKAMADQLATVSKQRLSERLAILTDADMKSVGGAIRVQLALEG